MRNNWFFFMDLDGESQYMFPLEPLLSQGFGANLFSQLSSFVDSPLHQSRFLYVPGTMAFQEALNRITKLAGGLIFWFTSASSSNLSRQISHNQRSPTPGSCRSFAHVNNSTSTRCDLAGSGFGSVSKGGSSPPVVFSTISRFVMRLLLREAERLQSFPFLSLAASLLLTRETPLPGKRTLWAQGAGKTPGCPRLLRGKWPLQGLNLGGDITLDD